MADPRARVEPAPCVSPDTRHRLLEGFLSRLARHPDAEGFVVRGGMYIRHAVPRIGRLANDLDLVCRLPYDPPAMRRRLAAILADRLDDGVGFDPASLELTGVWRGATPALWLRAFGAVGAAPAWLSVDLVFELPLWPEPAPVWMALPAGPARLWVCRAETIVARKMVVVTELGRKGWRTKDLADLQVLLARGVERVAMGEAIEHTFGLAGLPPPGQARRSPFTQVAWWAHPRVERRWRARPPAHAGLRDVSALAGSVCAALAPYAVRR